MPFRDLYILIFIGSSFLKCTNPEEIVYVETNSFGFEFFNSLNDGEVIDLPFSCSEQLQLLESAIKKKEQWALKFADAWAKIPSGIFYGHDMDMGNFDECLSINVPIEQNSNIHGKYCLSNLQINDKSHSLQQLNFDLGICIPNECHANEIELLINAYLNRKLNTTYNSAVKLIENNCTTRDRDPFQVLDWIAIGVLMALGILLILSTFYHVVAQKHGKPLHPLLSAFSIHKNMTQLMRIIPAERNSKYIIPALNGIRCLSIIWIIFLHTFSFLSLSPNVNNAEINSWHETLFHMVWKNGAYAVDTFFFLSGLLLISVAFREMEKNSGKLNIPLMYLHRFIRLSPVLYLAVLLFMTLFRYSGSGPIWNNFSSQYHLCEQTWWATIIYVQNYAAAGRMCLGHSWYLAVDTQLYIISPLVLILIWRWRKWGVAIVLFIGLLLVACLFSVIIVDKLTVFTTEQSQDSVMRKTYYPTHVRVSPWIIGIIFGYYLHINNGRRVILSKMMASLGWILAIMLFCAVIFSLYPKTQAGAKLMTPLEDAFYLSLSHVAWPLGMCWIVFACINGYAGPINDFLSWYIWQPMSKLSYCMYIWHYLIVIINAGSIKTNSYFSNYNAFLRFWGDFGMTLLVSTVMYLAIEAPMLGIEKYLLSKKPQNTDGVIKKAPTTISKENLVD